MKHHSHFYRWFCKVIYRMWEFEGWQQAQATGRMQAVQERQTDRIAQLDTQQVAAVTVPRSEPAQVALREPASTTTNVLRRYIATTHDDRRMCPGWFRSLYLHLREEGKL
jgi:hypothetical protein